MSEDKLTGFKLLRSPFPENQIGKLPKQAPKQKEALKGNRNLGISCPQCKQWHHKDVVHLDYVGHAALTLRLLDVDENWNWEPLSLDESGLPAFDKTGGLWIRLTVLKVSRIGYGNAATSQYKDVGAREKEVIGDALRNAGMRFGAALDLWHKGDLHLDPEPEKNPKPTPETVKKVIEVIIEQFANQDKPMTKDRLPALKTYFEKSNPSAQDKLVYNGLLATFNKDQETLKRQQEEINQNENSIEGKK